MRLNDEGERAEGALEGRAVGHRELHQSSLVKTWPSWVGGIAENATVNKNLKNSESEQLTLGESTYMQYVPPL